MLCMPPWQKARLAYHASIWHHCWSNECAPTECMQENLAAGRLCAYPPMTPKNIPPRAHGGGTSCCAPTGHPYMLLISTVQPKCLHTALQSRSLHKAQLAHTAHSCRQGQAMAFNQCERAWPLCTMSSTRSAGATFTFHLSNTALLIPGLRSSAIFPKRSLTHAPSTAQRPHSRKPRAMNQPPVTPQTSVEH